MPLGFRIKFVDVDQVQDIGRMWAATPTYLDSNFGPFLILAIEWLDIHSVEQVRRGLLKPEQVDHTEEVERRLQVVGVPYTKEESGIIRITGHARRRQTQQTKPEA